MSAPTKEYFHFTIGPVQGFVAQARRTRDFWAGSFLLSWLAAVAMRAVEQPGQDGKIVFPKPDPAFMEALRKGTTGPSQGNIPNRFKAEVPAGFNPKEVVAAVQHAWVGLAQRVYDKENLATIMPGPLSKEVWDRQVGNFWEIAWALTGDEKDSSVIDRLKNWRIHLPLDEPGAKCMMMEGWQELSGILAPQKYELKDFWTKVRNSGLTGMTTDLRENEHLCAIAYIKRRFARHFKLFSTTLCGLTFHGWELPSGVPSVHYMAAAHWLEELIRKANSDSNLSNDMWEFHNQAASLTGHSESQSNIRCVRKALAAGSGQKQWAALDGTVFFDAMLENPNLWDQAQQIQAAELLVKLKGLRKAAKLEPVSPFYAVLMMDGDQLGIQMSDTDNQKKITDALAVFIAEVKTIVESKSGFLIYAGGDDVLALLPLEDALTCAAALRKHYLDSFADTGIKTSLSGAIEYAHIKMPLGKVLHDAHDLLDNLAKEGRGRDAIACRVWKPGGLALEWAMPWECALEADQLTLKVEKLAETFQGSGKAGDDNDRFASKFFYRIRERFELLNPKECSYCREGELAQLSWDHQPVLSQDQALSLMAAEYLNSGAARVKTLNQARDIISPLLEQCRPVLREAGKPIGEWPKSTCLEVDGALLIRFLAHKGVER